MLAKGILIGRLGRDPELRYTAGGTAIANFPVACDRSFKKEGEAKRDTTWMDVVCFGKRAEVCSQYLHKGSLVFVEGEIQTRSWESDGVKRYKTEVVASEVKFLSKKEGSSGGSDYVAPEETTDLEPF